MAGYAVRVDGKACGVATDAEGNVSIDGNAVRLEVEEVSAHRYRVVLDGRQFVFLVERAGHDYRVFHEGIVHRVEVESGKENLAKRLAEGPAVKSGRREISAPLPALVRRVEVAVGDVVDAGAGLFVLEAMKMENEIRADRKGRVREICVAEGTTVEKGQLLLVLED